MKERDKIIDRIAKLSALAERTSTNENEAASAAAMAAKLMAEHDIEVAELRVEEGEPDEAVAAREIDSIGRNGIWKGNIANAVAKSMGCKSYRRAGGGPITIVGQPSKLGAVSYMHQYLVREIERIADEGWASAKHDTTQGVASWKHSFHEGATAIIVERLHSAREQALAQGRRRDEPAHKREALVAVRRDEEAVENFVRGLGLGRGRARFVRVTHGFARGVAAGRDVRIDQASSALPAPARQLRRGK